MKYAIYLKSFILTCTLFVFSLGYSQEYCVTFRDIDTLFTESEAQIIHSESDIEVRFLYGELGPEISEIRIGPLPSWTGPYGSDNFEESKLHWNHAYSHVLFNALPEGEKTITIDYNSYDEKIILEPIEVWAEGSYELEYDTTSLVNGGVITISGDIDSIGLGATGHNDYVIDNICAVVETVGLEDEEVNEFSCYPNPTTGILFLAFPEELEAVTITNCIGQVIYAQEVNALNTLRVDLSVYSKGVYFVTARMGADQITKKVVKR